MAAVIELARVHRPENLLEATNQTSKIVLPRVRFSRNLLLSEGSFDMKMFAVVVSIALLMFVVFPHASTAVAQATGVQATHAKQAKTMAPPTTINAGEMLFTEIWRAIDLSQIWQTKQSLVS
jgi:hypothetical protein